jgi:hypothetical protein
MTGTEAACLAEVVSAVAQEQPEGHATVLLVSRKKWNDLSPRTRRVIVVAGAAEGVLKVAALIDLARRPVDQVRGSKARWALAVTLVNSLGAVPIAYFAYGPRAT